MYTWRAQIGLNSPGTGPNMERDFHRFIPDGVGINTTRIPFSGTPSPEGLMDMVSHLENTFQGQPPGLRHVRLHLRQPHRRPRL